MSEVIKETTAEISEKNVILGPKGPKEF